MNRISNRQVVFNVIKEPVLRYTLLIALTTSILLCTYSFYFIIPQFGGQLAAYTKDASVRVATHLKGTLPLQEDALTQKSFTPYIQSEISLLMKDLRIEKIKIFTNTGDIVFSSDPKDIGQKNTHDYFFNLIAKGQIFSQVVKKDHKTMEGRIAGREVVETYVPLMTDGVFNGAVEVYYDISKNSHILSGLLKRLEITILLFSGTFLAVFILILLKASRNRIIRDNTEASLQKAHAKLEQTVIERTADLKQTNQTLRHEIEERKNAEESLQRSHDTQTIVNKLLKESIEKSVDQNDVIDTCLDLVLSLPWLSFESMGCIYVTDKNSDHLVMKSHKGFSKELQQTCATVPFGKCLCGLAAATEETVFASQVDKRHDIILHDMPDHGHYCIPILAKGKLLGVINIYVKAGHNFNKREEDFLKAVANTLAVILIQRQGEYHWKQFKKRLHQSQKMEAIGTLAGGIAHDFNNILSGIFGYAQLAVMNLDSPDKAKINIEQIHQGAKRATDLIQQILTFSRQSEHKKSPIKPYLIIKEALQFLRSSIPASIDIKEDIQSRAKVFANPTQIHQIVINLCTNSYHAMQETGGTLFVSLEQIDIRAQNQVPGIAIVPGSYVKLEIKDTGQGMASNILKKIFEPYFTTKPVSEGTGLGLAVVLGIVEEHKGYIKADSTPGKGSVFTIFLPIFNQENDAANPEPEEIPLKRGTEHIMVVDDEESILAYSCELLKDYGYKVSPFQDARLALKAFEIDPHQFDLVITDVTMPNMTGDDFAVKIMALRKEIPIILCTGFSKKISKARAIELGIKQYLKKPIESHTLLSSIRETLDEKPG